MGMADDLKDLPSHVLNAASIIPRALSLECT
jgi:hypothetical protein